MGPAPHPDNVGDASVRVGQIGGYGSIGMGLDQLVAVLIQQRYLSVLIDVHDGYAHVKLAARAPVVDGDDRYLVDVVPVGVSRGFVVRLGRKDKGAPYGTDKLELTGLSSPSRRQDLTLARSSSSSTL